MQAVRKVVRHAVRHEDSMRSYCRSLILFVLVAGFFLVFVVRAGSAQAGVATLSGVVTDSTGALIPGATAVLRGADGAEQTITTNAAGRYSFSGLTPGRYALVVSAAGFSPVQVPALQLAAAQTLIRDVQLQIAVVEQSVEVNESASLNTEPTSNASAVTISGTGLQVLSDDPDDLAQDLQMLAGPSVGPEGGEIYVDGFSGAKLPPKSAIREVRVNQNPFSAEFDRLGYGRVEIFTKPGADNLHGDVRMIYGNSIFNAQNPFAPTKPDYQRKMYDASVGGPLGRKTSFNFQFERREIGQAALINAMVLDSALNQVPYRASILNPRTNTEIGARLDYQLSANHTLIGRYEWEKDYRENDGLDTFSMATQAYNNDDREHVLQLTETAILSPRAVNEVKFQYRRSHDSNVALNNGPTIDVAGAFTAGGTAMNLDSVLENRYELQEMLSLSAGRHTLKLGGRLRAIREDNASGENFNGVFTFSSLDAYQITEAGLKAGLTPAQIRAQGGGASQFALSAGQPLAQVTQLDVGVFAQDDWRARNNLTLSAGLRYEAQTNIDDLGGWGPRLGLAWGIPGGTQGRPFAVLRLGYGGFYDRIRETLVLDSLRQNGVREVTYLISNPDFYPAVPDAATLSDYVQAQTVRQLAPALRAPDTQQFAVSLERQLPKNILLSVSYLNSRGTGLLRSRNINAPLPETGLRPLPGGNIYAYESTGRFRQDQLIMNVNARMSRRYNMFGYYVWSKARSNTDGADTFPASSYNLAAEYSRAGFDVRHRLMVGGTLVAPLGVMFNPFVVMHSGDPFNIVVGQDLNGDSIFNDRPAWATDLTRSSVVRSKWGNFDMQPIPGQTIIPRNLGSGPGMVAVNMRVSKAFGLGGHTGDAQAVSGPQGPSGPQLSSGPPRGHGPGGHGFMGMDPVAAGSRYSLTFSVLARNMLNTVNLSTPVGNLSSPLFGTSTSIHGFGPGGASANRMVDLQVRFSF